VVEVLENEGAGPELTSEVLDGILKHSKATERCCPTTGGAGRHVRRRVVRIADFMAYLNHDLDDAGAAGSYGRAGTRPAGACWEDPLGAGHHL